MSLSFDLKVWLDQNVVPHIIVEPKLALHTFLKNQAPTDDKPSQILVWLLALEDAHWAPAVKRLLESGFSFDHLRDAQVVGISPGNTITIFGGDGTPYIGKNGMASVRLFRRCDDGIELILEIGRGFSTAEAAVQAIKGFFAQFAGISPVELVAKFRPSFGSA